jgi:hypothetical protein
LKDAKYFASLDGKCRVFPKIERYMKKKHSKTLSVPFGAIEHPSYSLFSPALLSDNVMELVCLMPTT